MTVTTIVTYFRILTFLNSGTYYLTSRSGPNTNCYNMFVLHTRCPISYNTDLKIKTSVIRPTIWRQQITYQCRSVKQDFMETTNITNFHILTFLALRIILFLGLGLTQIVITYLWCTCAVPFLWHQWENIFLLYRFLS